MYRPDRNDESTMNIQYDKAKALYEDEKFVEALAEIDHAIAFYPDYVYNHILRSQILMDLDRLDESEASARKAIAVNPGNLDARLSLISLLLKEGRYEEVLSECTSSLAELPNEPDLYIYRAMAFVEQDKTDDALKSYMKVTQLEPSDSYAHFQIARILYRKGEYGKALREVNIGLRFSRKDEDARLLQISILFNMSKDRQAMEELDKALKIIPESSELAMWKSEILYENGDYVQSFTTLIDAYEHNPDPDLLLKVADMISEFGHPKEALAILDEGLQLTNDIRFKIRKINVLEEMDSLDEAVELANQWIEEGGETMELEEERVRLLISQQKDEMAEAEARKLFAKYSKNENALEILLLALENNGKPGEMNDILDNFMRENQETPFLLRHKSRALAQMKNFEGELECIRKAMTIMGENDLDRVAEAHTLYRLNRMDEAMESIKKVKDVEAFDTFITLLKAEITARKQNIEAGMSVLRQGTTENNKQLMWDAVRLEKELTTDETTSELLKQYLIEFNDDKVPVKQEP